uniref:Uncharacterized protein n=1 Tax=Strigops habroptila TaxID=2489341 RepID=A0A672TYK4_STRHB
LCISSVSWVWMEPRQSSCAISVAGQANVPCLCLLPMWLSIFVQGERAGRSIFVCPLLLGPPFFLLSPRWLQKQQWQQMKMNAMRTTKGRPNSTARQTVLKMPSSCLVRMSSKMELKKELIFCSMLAPGQAACAAPSA